MALWEWAEHCSRGGVELKARNKEPVADECGREGAGADRSPCSSFGEPGPAPLPASS